MATCEKKGSFATHFVQFPWTTKHSILINAILFFLNMSRKEILFSGNHSTFNFSKKTDKTDFPKPRGSSFSRQSSLTWITSFPCCGSKLGISLGAREATKTGSMDRPWEASKGTNFFLPQKNRCELLQGWKNFVKKRLDWLFKKKWGSRSKQKHMMFWVIFL